MPLATLQFALVYHPLHDILGIHTQVGVLILLMIYGLIVWASDRHPTSEARTPSNKGSSWFDEIFLVVIIHFGLYFLLAILEKPQHNKSTGIHQEIGDCNATTPLYTPIGIILQKKTYLCTKDYDEGYFDFHCLEADMAHAHGGWYTICGTPFPNHAEYIVVVTAFCLLGLFAYVQLLVFSGRQVKARPRAVKQKTKYN